MGTRLARYFRLAASGADRQLVDRLLLGNEARRDARLMPRER
jgi:hypothetical protein